MEPKMKPKSDRIRSPRKMNNTSIKKQISKNIVEKTFFLTLGWALWRTLASKDPKMMYFRSPLGTLKTIKNHQKDTLGRSWGPPCSIQGPSTLPWQPKCHFCYPHLSNLLSLLPPKLIEFAIQINHQKIVFVSASPASSADPASLNRICNAKKSLCRSH